MEYEFDDIVSKLRSAYHGRVLFEFNRGIDAMRKLLEKHEETIKLETALHEAQLANMVSLQTNEMLEMNIKTMEKEIEELKEENEQLETERDEGVSKYEQSLKRINELNPMNIETLEKKIKAEKEENEQLKVERDEARLNYQRALKTIETKSVQIENVNKEIKRMKRKFKDLCTSETKFEEKSNAVEKESTEVSEESDEALITNEWKYFHEKFQKLHNNLTSILHKTAEARNSNVLLENMKIVKELSEVAETVRRDFLSVTEKCSESIEEVLERLFPSDSNSEDEAQNPEEKRDCGLLD